MHQGSEEGGKGRDEGEGGGGRRVGGIERGGEGDVGRREGAMGKTSISMNNKTIQNLEINKSSFGCQKIKI